MTETPFTSEAALQRLKKRRGTEWRFRMWGRAAVVFALAALAWLMISIVGTGYTAFQQHFMEMEFELSESILAPDGTRDPAKLRGANYRRVVQNTMYEHFPEVTGRKDKQALFALVSASGATNQIRQMVYKNPDLVGRTVTVTVLPTRSGFLYTI